MSNTLRCCIRVFSELLETHSVTKCQACVYMWYFLLSTYVSPAGLKLKQRRYFISSCGFGLETTMLSPLWYLRQHQNVTFPGPKLVLRCLFLKQLTLMHMKLRYLYVICLMCSGWCQKAWQKLHLHYIYVYAAVCKLIVLNIFSAVALWGSLQCVVIDISKHVLITQWC